MAEGKDLQVVQCGQLTTVEVLAQVGAIQELMQKVMKDKEHYGKIPGVDKPSLWKAGAEKLCLTFRLDPQYDSTEIYDGDNLTVKSKCTLFYIPTGTRMGSGEGSCSTKESKYAYRKAGRTCPTCGKEDTVIKGKEEYGGGWLCFKKKDGCGAKFVDNDPAIVNQVTGRIPNEDIPDQYNTILKMANKRSLIAAVLNVTAASDIFTQDIEDFTNNPEPEKPAKEEFKSAVPIEDAFYQMTPEEEKQVLNQGKTEPSGLFNKDTKESKVIILAQLQNKRLSEYAPEIIKDIGGDVKGGKFTEAYNKLTLNQAQAIIRKYEIKRNLSLPATKEALPEFLKEIGGSWDKFLNLPFETQKDLFMRYGN
jgi:predicted small secreted protein